MKVLIYIYELIGKEIDPKHKVTKVKRDAINKLHMWCYFDDGSDKNVGKNVWIKMELARIFSLIKLLTKKPKSSNEIKTKEELEKAMIKYIEYYNNERIMEKTKGLSPLTYRQQSFVQPGY